MLSYQHSRFVSHLLLASDSRELKRKLSRDNSVFLMSPRREGCTLTISLKPPSLGGADGQAKGSKTVDTSNLALAGVRFQVGSTSSDCIPKKVYVQGRPVTIQSGTKKVGRNVLLDIEQQVQMFLSFLLANSGIRSH